MDVYVVVARMDQPGMEHIEVLDAMPRWIPADGARVYLASVNGGDSKELAWWDGTPVMTVWGNGYALVLESPTGPVAIELTPAQASTYGDAGLNYIEEAHGRVKEALDLLS